MNAFQFQTVPSIVSEFGLSRRLGAFLRENKYHQRRAAVLTDRFLHEGGVIRPALDSLREHGFEIVVVDNVIADPPERIVHEAVDCLRDAGIELIIGLGGGSSLDVAKLTAVLVGSRQPLHEMYGIGKVVGSRLPMILIPTTAGTGSEVTPIAVITTGETTKMGVVSPVLYADLALLDAELTLGLPPKATAATGIDAMVHAIEAYTSRHKKNPVSDALAKVALGLLVPNLLPACRNGQDRTAREAMLLGAMLAGQAFANAPVGAVHALAYPIGGIFHVPHGHSNALVLPHVLRFNLSAAMPLYAELADVIVPGVPGAPERKAEALIDRLEELAGQAGIETRLRQVGVAETDLERMAADAMKQTRLLVNNPREVSEADALAIYRAAW
ncbi:MAG: iron-containing alcohol dehydrogenase [Verrucomicrobia bacterium]|nr:iron-containing alcohol dehydrogenase [Verrucomicrobiota bacterium]